MPRNPELPSVSVIVPTYQYSSKLEVTVRALLEDPAATEIIVVVDGCLDGSLELLERIRDEDARVVPMFVEHVGKSGALTAALERAVGDVVLLLDQDVVAKPGLVSGHAAHHRDAEHLLVLGYMPTLTNGSDGHVAMLTKCYADEYEAHVTFLEDNPECVLLQLWGGNVSLLREDCMQVGLDFRYFGHEDQDFGIRCQKAGLTGRFDRKLLAEHHHARDATQFLWYSKMQGASSWLIHQEHRDVVGPYDPDSTLEGLPTAVRRLAALMATPRLGDQWAEFLATLGDLLARLGWSRGESSAYRLARRVELRTGAVLARAGRDRDLQQLSTPLWSGHRSRFTDSR
jgi:glycosyltransferase involved in cell wall biosynthesis